MPAVYFDLFDQKWDSVTRTGGECRNIELHIKLGRYCPRESSGYVPSSSRSINAVELTS